MRKIVHFATKWISYYFKYWRKHCCLNVQHLKIFKFFYLTLLKKSWPGSWSGSGTGSRVTWKVGSRKKIFGHDKLKKELNSHILVINLLLCLDVCHEADPPDPHQGQLPLRRSHQDCPQGAGRQQGTVPMVQFSSLVSTVPASVVCVGTGIRDARGCKYSEYDVHQTAIFIYLF